MITRFCVFHVQNNVEARIRGFRRRKKQYMSHMKVVDPRDAIIGMYESFFAV